MAKMRKTQKNRKNNTVLRKIWHYNKYHNITRKATMMKKNIFQYFKLFKKNNGFILKRFLNYIQISGTAGIASKIIFGKIKSLEAVGTINLGGTAAWRLLAASGCTGRSGTAGIGARTRC